MSFIKLLSVAGLIGSIVWCFADPGYEPAIAIITSLSALAGSFCVERKRGQQESQNQVVSKNGFGIQAGGNVSTGDIKIGQGQKDVK